jgi:cell division protein FtsW
MRAFSLKATATYSVLYDYKLIWALVLLLGFGLVMVYSASIALAQADPLVGYYGEYFFWRQLILLCAGILVSMIIFRIPMAVWHQWAWLLFLLGIFALLLVLIPKIGYSVNGSRRWIHLGMTVQPSEFMKLCVVLYAADYVVRKKEYMNDIKRGFIPLLMAMLLVGFELLLEPDFGAFLVMMLIAISLLFLGGLPIRYFVLLLVISLGGFVSLVVFSPYRLARLMWFWNPWADPYGKGYQLTHALIAFGHGGLLGMGLGGSVEKQLYLPEAHTDFLLAVIAEELGLFGVLIVLGLFAFVVWRAFKIGWGAVLTDRPFDALVAQGIGLWFGVQGIINMGVNEGLLPTKGLTLPLLSYGGSGIIANMMAATLLLRIDHESRLLMWKRAP